MEGSFRRLTYLSFWSASHRGRSAAEPNEPRSTSTSVKYLNKINSHHQYSITSGPTIQ